MDKYDRHGLILVSLLVILVVGAGSDALLGAEKSNLLLYVPFEGKAEAKIARGNSEPSRKAGVNYVQGRSGLGVAIAKETRLGYAANNNINPSAGTILMWVKPNWSAGDDFDQQSRAFFDAGNWNQNNSDIYLQYRKIESGLGVTFDPVSRGSFTGEKLDWQAGQWHHLALTWDVRKGFKLYADGRLYLSKDVSWVAALVSREMALGIGSSFMGNAIDAVIDEFYIYDRSLTGLEIVRVMEWQGSGLPEIPWHAVAYRPWSMPVTYNLRQPLPFRHVVTPDSTAHIRDLDGDGLYEIITRNSFPKKVYVFDNVGTRQEPRYHFDTRQQYNISPVDGDYGSDRKYKYQHYYAFDVADWNNDGQWDVIPGVILHSNRGTNTAPKFENMGPFTVGGTPYPYLCKYKSCRQADLDGDGVKDLIVFSKTSSEPGMYPGEAGAKAREEMGKEGWDVNKTPRPRPRLHFCKNAGTNENPKFDKIEDILLGGMTVDEYVLAMPFPEFVDWDDDGDLDLICGDYARNVYFFRNVGSATLPKFEPDKLKLAKGFQRLQPAHVPAVATKITLPVAKIPTRIEQSISIELPENNTCPNAVDWDGDGDLDLIVSTKDGLLYFLENVGTRKKPVLAKYKLVEQPLDTSPNAQLGWGNWFIPQVVDWDADGDMDIISGGEQGFVYYYENVGGEGKKRQFKKPVQLTMVNGNPIWLADIVDGYFDGLWCPGISVSSGHFYGYTEPTVIDMDSDGDLDIITGDISLRLRYIENIGSRTKPVLKAPRPLKLDDELYSGGWRSRPGAIDFDGDGVVEVIHPQLNGVYYMYKVARRGSELYLTSARPLLDEKGQPFKTLAGGGTRQQGSIVDWNRDGQYDLLVGGRRGQVIYCQNTGSNTEPVFRSELLTVGSNRFHVEMCQHSVGVWAHDWDGDGTLDLLGGTDSGWLFAYDGKMFDQH